jgi:hypothetical protein
VRPAGYVCRASVDTCDPAEVCDGTSINCPANVLAPPGTECRPANGPCDETDYCGSGGSCPDTKKPDGASCGSGLYCQGGQCTGCGHENGSCCPGGGCAASDLVCGSNNTCQKCGYAGGPCCTQGAACDATLQQPMFCKGIPGHPLSVCDPCALEGQDCCPANLGLPICLTVPHNQTLSCDGNQHCNLESL